jgi:hypothetical protein
MVEREVSKQYRDVLTRVIQEANQYNTIEDIEKLVENGANLSAIPIQPLFLALRQSSLEQIAEILPKLSTQQRQCLLDIDLWHKDELDVDHFSKWPTIYSLCNDRAITRELIQSEQFLLYLKGRFSIHTFDDEEPVYPDHDNYFLTEDHLLLFEYDESVVNVNEIEHLIKLLYGELGVENAYTFLFKLVVDNYSIFQEEEYKNKKDRLRDIGFVDYYDAIEFKSFYHSIEQLNSFIRSKKGVTASIEADGLNQNVHANTIVAYRMGLDEIHQELEKLVEQKRIDFLRFNFVRLINGSIALENGLKQGSVALNRIGKQTKQYIELAFSYLKKYLTNENCVFERFDFIDLYRIGGSLINIEQKRIKKMLAEYGLDSSSEYFLGEFWNKNLDSFFSSPVGMVSFDSSKIVVIENINQLEKFRFYLEVLVQLMPFILKFKLTLDELIEKSKINNQFYLNYEIDQIDFDVLISSSFINWSLNSNDQTAKLGVTVDQFKLFVSKFFTTKDEQSVIKENEGELSQAIASFSKQFGLDSVNHFDAYLYHMLKHNLEGYDFHQLTKDEFQHVGGVLLFAV